MLKPHVCCHAPDSSALSGGLKKTLGTLSISHSWTQNSYKCLFKQQFAATHLTPLPCRQLSGGLKKTLSMLHNTAQLLQTRALAATAKPLDPVNLAASAPDSSALSGGLKKTLGTLSIDTMVSASAEQPMAAPAHSAMHSRKQQKSTSACH
jgi:hypothetical protein